MLRAQEQVRRGRGALPRDPCALQREELGDDDGETLKTAERAGRASFAGRAIFEAPRRCSTRSSKTQLRVRGEEHPDTLQSLTTLAHIRNEQGRFDEALDLCDRAIEAGSRSLGAEHTAVLQAAIEKVAALAGLGRESEARALAEIVIGGYSGALGTDHPSTIEAQKLVD